MCYSVVMKKLVTTLSLLLSLSSGCSGCTSLAQPNLDVVRNKAMNTTDVPAHGDSWNLTLPPNYVIVKHDFDMIGEELVAKSRYQIGDYPIMITVAAVPYEDADKMAPARAAASAALEAEGWTTVFGPEQVLIGKNAGQLVAGNLNELIIYQFTMVHGRHAYVMQCSGSDSSRARVGYRCKDMLDRFQPTSVARPTPLVDSVPTQ